MREHSHCGIARFVIEAVAPLSIATGHPDGLDDVVLVRDANGLPMIPGTALAGALRSLHARRHERADALREGVTTPTERLFGWQEADNGARSRVWTSHGVLLDRHGRAVEGLLAGEQRSQLDTDPLLQRARAVDAAVSRDRVRIAARGAAADGGLFNRTVLPAGYRFAAEIRAWMRGDEGATAWPELLALLRHPLLRLGGSTRSGLGAVRLVDLHARIFALDLARDGDEVDVRDFGALGRSLSDTELLSAAPAENGEDGHLATARIRLKPIDGWRIGGGTTPLEDPGASATRSGNALVPKRESRVQWDDGKGDVGEEAVLVPGASVKGVLAHRVAFHANRLAGVFAEDLAEPAWAYDAHQQSEAVARLFGVIKADGDEATSAGGQAGRIYIDDAWLPLNAVRVETRTHNAIDRFSGGVRNRMLFSEQVLTDGAITLDLTMDLSGIAPDDPALVALDTSLDDLVHGRLGLGARVSAGNGFMMGALRWNRRPEGFEQVLNDRGEDHGVA